MKQPAEKKEKEKKITFEDALLRMEELVKGMEDGSLGLDEAINAYEEGIKLAKYCHDRLEEAERKIELLQKGTSGDDKVKSKPLKIKEESGEIEDDEEVQGSLL